MTSTDQTGPEIAVPPKTAGQVAVSANKRANYAIFASCAAIAISAASVGMNYMQPQMSMAQKAQEPTALSARPVAQQPAPIIAPQPVAPSITASSEPQAPSPLNLSTEDVQIIPDGNNIYAHVRPTDEWLIFRDGNGTPEVVADADIPQAVRDRTSSVTPSTNIDVAAVEQQAQRATENLDLATNPDPDLKINLLLQNPETAESILAGLQQLNGIHVPGAVRAENPVFVFFDPRCPYCHQAFARIDGKANAIWIPTLAPALGDPSVAGGAPRLMSSLGEMSIEKNAEGKVTSVALSDDPGRVARLRDVMTSNTWPADAPVELSEGAQFISDESMTILAQLYSVGNTTDLLAVPTFVVPDGKGTAIMYRGLDDEIINLILSPETGNQG